MLRGDQSRERVSHAAPANRLVIRCRGPKRQRTLVYVCQGVPPVTSAEVEIMHQHLEESARKVRDAAQNDI